MAETYSKEYSFFSDSFFVAFEPAELHSYLDKIIFVEPPMAEEDKRGEELDREVLPYILLRRSRMHALDLRRQLEWVEDGLQKLHTGDLRSQRAFRLDILIQVAVEVLLSGPAMKDRLQRDPTFRQLTYDTLYYPSDIWEKQQDLDASEAALIHYLWERTGVKEEVVSPNPDASMPGQVPERFLSQADREFLHQRLAQMVSYLIQPPVLVVDAATTSLAETIVAAIEREPLLEAIPDNDQRYRWRFDTAGRSLPRDVSATESTGLPRESPEPTVEFGVAPEAVKQASTVQTPAPPQTLRGAAVLIEQVQAILTELTQDALTLERLCNEYRLLPTTPAWSAVEMALSRLEQNNALSGDPNQTPATYPESDQDQSNVIEFADNLYKNAGSAIGAILCALAVGKMEGGSLGTQMVLGLRALSAELTRRGVAESTIRSARKSLFDSLTRLEEALSPPLEWNKLGTLIRTVESSSSVTPARRENYLNSVFREWESRFTRYLRDGKTQFDPIIEEFLTGANDSHYIISATDPRSIFPDFDLRQTSLLKWTAAFSRAVEIQDGPPGRGVLPVLPTRFAVPCLHALGFSTAAKDVALHLALASPELSPDVRFWSEFIRVEPKPGVAVLDTPILPSTEPSPVKDWKPSPSFAALCWTADGWEQQIALPLARLLSIPPESIIKALNIDTVLVALNGSDEDALRVLGTAMQMPKSLSPLGRLTAFVLPTRTRAERLAAQTPFPCIAAKDLDDAMAQVNAARTKK